MGELMIIAWRETISAGASAVCLTGTSNKATATARANISWRLLGRQRNSRRCLAKPAQQCAQVRHKPSNRGSSAGAGAASSKNSTSPRR
ncbi:hypothetical protein D3C77_525590 [compost metagenome]